MEYTYENTTYDLRELPPSLQARIGEAEVVTALHNYLDAYTADKYTIEERDAYDDVWATPTPGLDARNKLRRACTQSRKRRKTAWFALLDVLGEDYDYSSTDDDLD
jgi:hypothetical protein